MRAGRKIRIVLSGEGMFMKKTFALLTAAAFGLAFVTAIAEEAALAQAQQQASSLTVLASSKEEIRQMK